jgi:hypothetical protein
LSRMGCAVGGLHFEAWAHQQSHTLLPTSRRRRCCIRHAATSRPTLHAQGVAEPQCPRPARTLWLCPALGPPGHRGDRIPCECTQRDGARTTEFPTTPSLASHSERALRSASS